MGLAGAKASCQELPFLVPSSFSAEVGHSVSLALSPTRSEVALVPISATVCGHETRKNYEADLSNLRWDGPGSALAAVTFGPQSRQDGPLLLSHFGLSGPEQLTVIASATAAISGKSEGVALLNRLGLPSELRLITSPIRAAGADVALRFYGFKEMVANNAPVLATHLATGVTTKLETDAAGIVNLARVKAGVWRVAAAQLHESKLFLATITFEVTR